MIVSWNELQRTCQKAFRGLGVPAGADDDASFAVLWLQARGLEALAPLEAALSTLERAPPRPLGVAGGTDGVDVLEAGGQSAVSVASDALDFAIARAVECGVRAEVRLTGVEGAIFVAGALAQRTAGGRCARVEWWRHGTPHRLDVSAEDGCRVCVAPLESEDRSHRRPRDAARIVIDPASGGRWMELRAPWRIDARHAELEHRAARSAALGIEVPDGLWGHLLAFARRTLVPSTRTSRESGAGGGEYDD